MTPNLKLTSIRCPEDRKHKNTSSGVEYPTCGHLLAAIKDGIIYMRCPVCKEFWELNVEDDYNVIMKRIPKEVKIELLNNLRFIEKWEQSENL